MKTLKSLVSKIALTLLCVLLTQFVQVEDVLVLKNGDRITGEISRIWDNEITIEPEYSDEFQVDLPVVDYIESDREFEIDLQDGSTVLASFGGADEDGAQIITTSIESLEITLASISELDEIDAYYDWESHVDLTGNLNKGNTDSANTKLRADGTFKHGDHRHRGEISFSREELSGVLTQEQDRFSYNYNWIYNDPWFFTANLNFERDPIVQLNSRVILSAGIGHDIWNTPRKNLSATIGFGLQTEEIGLGLPGPILPQTVSKQSSVAVWALRFRHDFFGDDLSVFHNHNITANVSGRTNTSYRTSTGINYEITDLLYANASIDYDYDTEPAFTAKNEDISILFGLGLEFE
jgi:putative salt-induced outer membrane protein YdiY